jgi:hypothetical protein
MSTDIRSLTKPKDGTDWRLNRECQWCHKKGTIITAFLIYKYSSRPRVKVQRKCNNSKCLYSPEQRIWTYDDTWESPLDEYEEIREWMKQNKKDAEELTILDEKINAIKAGKKTIKPIKKNRVHNQ